MSRNGKPNRTQQKKRRRQESEKRARRSSCFQSCCFYTVCLCSFWLLGTFSYSYYTAPTKDALPETPGFKLRRLGLRAKHPVVFVPGIVTGALDLWEGKQCAHRLFRERFWGGSFANLLQEPLCWLAHMQLDNNTGLDPAGIRVRPVSGLVSADYFFPGYFVWGKLIENLGNLGYEEKNLYMAAYDWRLAFQNTEIRDNSFTRLKNTIEFMVSTNGQRKAVIVPHSMGVVYFLQFMSWVEAPPPMGGGGGPKWCSRYIKAVMNVGGPFLGVPKAASVLFSAEATDSVYWRVLASRIFYSMGIDQFFSHIMRLTRSWDSVMSVLPKGGDTIWGGLDWSPEKGHTCPGKRQKSYETRGDEAGEGRVSMRKTVNYGRMISFGKEVAKSAPSEMKTVDFRGAAKGQRITNHTCHDAWTEYNEMGTAGIKAISGYKVYTADAVIDLLLYVAPKMMARGETHFSYGIADDLDDPKYKHPKYWSNPLESKLPNAPNMEIFTMYGVGIPTERAYLYRVKPSHCIPFGLFTSAEEEDRCLKGGIYYTDGDGTVPVLSAGFMAAKAWRGKTRFNPAGMTTFVREYDHYPPANFFDFRGTESGDHVNIMGNHALIEDILVVAAGGNGADIGGDRVFSDIFEMSESIDLKL